MSSSELYTSTNRKCDDLIALYHRSADLQTKEEIVELNIYIQRIYALIGKLSIYEELNNTLRIKETTAKIKQQMAFFDYKIQSIQKTQ